MMLRLMYITLALVAASELSIQEDPYNRGVQRPNHDVIACDENEVSFKGHCYMFSTDKETGLRATTICERLGSALVTISSKEEFEFLKNTITGDSRLNGMNYLTGARKIRKKWRWLSGGKIGSCWAPGKPEIRRNRNCACMSPSHNYDMINLKCAQLQRYICEKEFSALSRDQIPKGGCMCMVRGDPHYMTCDGKRHNFQGNCTYTTFLDQLHSNQPYFKVMAKNEHNPQNSRKVTYQKTITVELFHPDFKTSHSVVLFRNHTIYLDGVSVTPPSNPEEGLIISYFGRHILLETSFGFWVTWDFRHRTEMRAPPEYENNIGGMCGNCDGNPDNDYFSPDGSLAKSSKEYGNSWKTSISCPDVYEEEQECDNDIQNLYTGSDQCGLIKDTTGPFAECIAELDSETVDGFFKDCIYDMCYIGGNDTLCDSIESMYDECMYIGVQVSTFRTTTFCPLDCPNNSRYTPSASPCEKTCVEPSAADFCPELNTEMCECIDGYVRSGVDCVRSTDCGCRGADNIYRLRGETWKNSNCTETCTCTEGGIVCEEVICDVNSLCSPVDGVYTCVCSPGYSGDGITCTLNDACPAGAISSGCSLIGGLCKTSCDENVDHLAMNKLLCPGDCFCCHQSTDLCSTSHFGGYCYPDCQESMVALENAAFCESRKCCKPRRIPGLGYYNPDPVEVNGVTITPAMLEKNSSQTRPVLGIDSSKTRPDTGTDGTPTEDEYVLFGTTYGGFKVPNYIGGGDGGGPGGQGDPIIKTGDGFRFKFIGDACRYILFQEDSDDPSYRVVTHHFGGSIFGKEAYFIGSVTVDYGGQRLQLLEGNNIKVNEKDVTSQISTNSTVFGDFALKWNNRRRKFMTADVGPGCFAVIWNGHEGHVNVYPSADLSGKVTGILGNFNGKKEDDLQFQESGKWHTLPLLATKKDMARFSRGWRLDLNSC